jgi:hypothetical protein
MTFITDRNEERNLFNFYLELFCSYLYEESMTSVNSNYSSESLLIINAEKIPIMKNS